MDTELIKTAATAVQGFAALYIAFIASYSLKTFKNQKIIERQHSTAHELLETIHKAKYALDFCRRCFTDASETAAAKSKVQSGLTDVIEAQVFIDRWVSKQEIFNECSKLSDLARRNFKNKALENFIEHLNSIFNEVACEMDVSRRGHPPQDFISIRYADASSTDRHTTSISETILEIEKILLPYAR